MVIKIGCDITVHCEYRKDGVWHNCDNFEWDQETGKYEFYPIYDGRNYDLFGVLAGVRCNDFPSIDVPRGLPKDMALKTKEMAESDLSWTHSHSYVTLREMLEWKRKRTKEWKKLKKKYVIKHDSHEGDFILDDDMYPTFKYEKHLLDYLIRRMKDKMGDHIGCYEKDDYYAKGDDFRIVFWFDN